MNTFVDRTDELFARSRGQCEYVKSHEQARELLASVKVAALDFETTALSPLNGEIRLTSVCNDDVHFIIDHFFLEPFEEYIDLVADPDKIWWVFNAKFELATWIDHYDDEEKAVVYDVDFAKKAKMGGMPNKLAWMAKDVGVKMAKDEQTSNWGTPQLSQSQLDYAGFDSFVTWELKKHWWDKELNDEQRKGFHVFNDAVRATAECERTGLVLDAEYHRELVDLWKLKHATFERYLRKWTSPDVIKNLRSNPQVGRFLERELPRDLLTVWPRTDKKKELQLEGKYLRAVSRRVSYPMSRWLAALAGFKYYGKYLDTYGDTLLGIQHNQGKITSRFNIGQAATGRYSSSSSNLQNIPRKPVVRRSFSIARPSVAKRVPANSPLIGSKLMCLADYSGIEVRVLAELSQDETLLQDAIYGDVHAASACQIYGHDLEYFIEAYKSGGSGKYANVYPVFKEQRSLAKGFTFQLCVAKDTLVLTDRGEVPIQHVTTNMRVWDGVEWVKHDGAVNNGLREVVTYDGLTATPDHRVFCTDGAVRPISDAMSSGQTSIISRAGVGEVPVEHSVTYSGYYRAERERRDAIVPLLRMWQAAAEMAAQYFSWSRFYVYVPEAQETLYRSGAYSDVAVLCHRRTLQALWSKLTVLRTARNTLSVQKLSGLYRAYSSVVSYLDSGGLKDFASRQDRQRWELREGQHTLSLSKEKPAEQAEVWDLLNCGPRHRFVANGRLVSNTYGAGPAALSDVLRCTYDEAIRAIEKWAARYSKAYGYRDVMFDEMNATGFLPVCDGRTIYVWKNERSMPVAANYPVQSAAASVMLRAVYRVRERFLNHGLDAYLAATVHDELLCYAHKDHADEAMSQQIAGMTEAWTDIFPNTTTDNLLDYAIGTTWAAKP